MSGKTLVRIVLQDDMTRDKMSEVFSKFDGDNITVSKQSGEKIPCNNE